MRNGNAKIDEGLMQLFARVVGQLDCGKDEVLYPEETNNVPFFDLTWDLNIAEDQDKLIRQIISPQMAEMKPHLLSRSNRVREATQASWELAKATCLVIIDKPEDYDLQSFFDSLLSRITAPTDKERTRAFFQKVIAAVFPEDIANSNG